MKCMFRFVVGGACLVIPVLVSLLSGSAAFAQASGSPDYPKQIVSVVIEKPGPYTQPPPTLEDTTTKEPVVLINVEFKATFTMTILGLTENEFIGNDATSSIACDYAELNITQPSHTTVKRANLDANGKYQDHYALEGNKMLLEHSVHTVSASSSWRYARIAQGTSYSSYVNGSASHQFKAELDSQ